MDKLELITAFTSSIVLFSQAYDPVEWITSVIKISDVAFYLVVTANIQYNWRIYSQTDAEVGQFPSSINFFLEESTEFELIGNIKEGHSV